MMGDRVLIGEIRGAEALELLDAYNTGHEGSISTGHANSCKDMLSRIESMVMMGSNMPVYVIREKIASSIDIMIYLARLRDGTRKVVEISEVKGYFDNHVELNPLYVFEESDCEDKSKVKGRLVKTGNDIIFTEKLKKAGI